MGVLGIELNGMMGMTLVVEMAPRNEGKWIRATERVNDAGWSVTAVGLNWVYKKYAYKIFYLLPKESLPGTFSFIIKIFQAQTPCSSLHWPSFLLHHKQFVSTLVCNIFVSITESIYIHFHTNLYRCTCNKRRSTRTALISNNHCILTPT